MAISGLDLLKVKIRRALSVSAALDSGYAKINLEEIEESVYWTLVQYEEREVAQLSGFGFQERI